MSSLSISYITFGFFVTMAPPKTWSGYFLRFSMCALIAFSTAAGFMPIAVEQPPAWWSLGLRLSGAFVAVMLFERHFGFKQQWGFVCESVYKVWQCLKSFKLKRAASTKFAEYKRAWLDRVCRVRRQ